MNMSRKVVYNGGSMSPFWDSDCFYNQYHNRFTVELDHEIDAEILAKAWEKTGKVYPLIDCIPERVDGDIVFYKDDRKNVPIKSVKPLNPGKEITCGRVFSVTYYGRSVSMSAFHSVVDGGGINKIFSTFIYFYLSLYTGVSDENPPVMIEEGRQPQEYFQSLSTLETGDFIQQPLVTYPKRKGMFVDNNMIPDEDGNLWAARVKVSVDKFVALCKKNGANPSSMLAALLARAAYKLHPDNDGNIAFVLTMDARKSFHVPESIANCSTNLLIPITYEDAADDNLSVLAKKIRSTIDYQRKDDFIKTLAKFYETYDWILAKRYAVVTYIGKIDIGTNTKHIKKFEMTDDAVCSLFMMELNNEFVITFQFGKATEKYMTAIVDILKDLGIETQIISEPHVIDRDVDEPMLM
jgi:hypothetical protein